MNQNQIVGEIKYRFASLLLNQLLEDNIITKEEWASFKKKLIKKYNPIITRLNSKKFARNPRPMSGYFRCRDLDSPTPIVA